MGAMGSSVKCILPENRLVGERWLRASIGRVDDRPLNRANQTLRDALPSGHSSDPESRFRERSVQSSQDNNRYISTIIAVDLHF